MKKAVLGLGEELKADDGIGKYIIGELKRKKSKDLLIHSDVPENAFTKLRKKKIGYLTIVDAADFGGKPGQIKIVGDFSEPGQLSTHSTNVSKVAKYIKKSIKIGNIRIILIQAKNLDFGQEMCEEVKSSGDIVADLLL